MGEDCSTPLKKNGRPREYDREEMMDKLIEFADKDTSLTLGQFSAEYWIPSSSVLRFVDEDENFRKVYEICKNKIGHRRERLYAQGSIPQVSYTRYVRRFDCFLHAEERDDLKFEIETKVKAGAAVNTAPNHEHLNEMAKALKAINLHAVRKQEEEHSSIADEPEADSVVPGIE
jgi:hypothetical protein